MERDEPGKPVLFGGDPANDIHPATTSQNGVVILGPAWAVEEGPLGPGAPEVPARDRRFGVFRGARGAFEGMSRE